jgi:MFS transporter, MHS family, proline/betaine transporter
LISCAARFGTMVALGVATAVLTLGIEWRIAFWMGAGIAVIGSVARTRLRETPDFLTMKGHISPPPQPLEERINPRAEIQEFTSANKKIPKKTIIAYFLMSSGPPACLYFTYMYFSNLLKMAGMGADAIIRQNFILSVIEFITSVLIIYLSSKVYPLKIVRWRSSLYFAFILIFPFVMGWVENYKFIFFIQVVSIIFTLTGVPAIPILIKHFPVLSRFTYTSFIYALSRAVVYIITSFGLVYFTEWFDHWGVSIILLPIALGFLWGVRHFEKLEEGETFPQEMAVGKG